MSRLHYTGLSLIELMIALSISSVILLASVHLLQHTIKNYQQQQRYIQTLEKIRYLEFIFSRTIHMAGFFGCHTIQHTHINNNLKNLLLLNPYSHDLKNFPTALIAYHVDHYLHLPSFIRRYAKQYSDVLIINHLSARTTTLQRTMQNRYAPLIINNKLTFKKNDIVVIDDCKKADIFAVSSLSNNNPILIRHNITSKNKSAKLSHVYQAGAQIGKFVWQMFYIRQTHKDPETYGLFLQTQTGRSEEISDGIDDLHIYFATYANLKHYLPSHLIKYLSEIVKVKIILTLNETAKQTKTITFYLSLRN